MLVVQWRRAQPAVVDVAPTEREAAPMSPEAIADRVRISAVREWFLAEGMTNLDSGGLSRTLSALGWHLDACAATHNSSIGVIFRGPNKLPL